MPSPPKTTDAEIISAARRLLERVGESGLSMNEVASAVGVRAPSLYGRFADRAAILTAIQLDLWRDLAGALGRAARSSDEPVEGLRAQARAYRAFAKANPRGYALIMNVDAETTDEGKRARAAAVGFALPPLASLVGEEHALAAARVLTPFLHGFVSMELAGGFRLGGGVEAAFDFGVTTIIDGLRRARGASRTNAKRSRSR
jgi:AcrR family transcriptional regulator